ncbi:MAG TPA: hypothetical protein VK387_05790 [Thermoleophilaceae bacterium]|nr:hypothetical protein [Thermoleophilaceae bacterium]
MSRGQRLALLGLAAVVAVVAVVLIRPGGGSEQSRNQETGSSSGTAPPSPGRAEPRPAPARPSTTTVRVRDGRPVGGVQEVTVESGETVRLAFTSNREDRLHVHGYDRYVELRPGRTTRVSFPARLEGVFAIESHSIAAEVASLTVVP